MRTKVTKWSGIHDKIIVSVVLLFLLLLLLIIIIIIVIITLQSQLPTWKLLFYSTHRFTWTWRLRGLGFWHCLQMMQPLLHTADHCSDVSLNSVLKTTLRYDPSFRTLSTRSSFVILTTRRTQSGRWSTFGKRVWFTESHLVSIISFLLLVLFTEFIVDIK